MFRHRFYALVTVMVWLVAGFASVRWPDTALAKSFEAVTVLLALMLREALGRTQSYFEDRRQADTTPVKMNRRSTDVGVDK